MRTRMLVWCLLVGFFGPAGLSNYQPSTTQSGLSPEVVQALMQQFPALGGQSQQPNTLASMGYSFPGVSLYQGQGTGSFGNALSPFESAGGSSPESITGALATGSLGKSASQSPAGGGGGGFGNLSLPSLQLPMAQVAASQAASADQGGGLGGDTGMGASAGVGNGSGMGAIGSVGQELAPSIFAGQSTGPTQSSIQGSDQQAFGQQRAGERDMSTLGGSFMDVPGINGIALPALNVTGPGGAGPSVFQGGPNPTSLFGSEATPSLGVPGTGSPIPGALQPNPGDILGGVNFESPAMAAPGGSAQFALGNQNLPQVVQPGSDLLGSLQGGVQAAGGLLGAVSGFGSGNVLGGTMGSLQSLGGVTQLLQSNPQLMQAMGLNTDLVSGVGGALGSVGGLYSLYQGVQTGDPMQIVSGLLAAYNGGSAVAGQLLGTALPSISTAFASVAPEAAMAVATAFGGEAATAAASAASAAGASASQAAGAALSAAIGGVAAVAAPVIMAITSYLSNQEEMNARTAGYTNNPIKGQLSSASTAGVQSVNNALANAGDLNTQSPLQLGDLLAGGLTSLLPYYSTAQGGQGAIKASDTFTGGNGPQQSAALGGADQYTANQQHALQGLMDTIASLSKQGAPPEAIWSLPTTGDFVQQNLDMDPAWLSNYYQANAGQYNQEASQIISRLVSGLQQTPVTSWVSTGQGGYEAPTGQMSYSLNGQPIDLTQLTPQALFNAMQGAARYGTAADTNASGLVTNMFGGPTGAALARMYYNPSGGQWSSAQGPLPGLSFDPWVQARQMSPDQLFAALTSNGAMNPANQVQATGANVGPVGVGHFTPADLQMGAQNPYWAQQISAQAARDPYALALQQYQGQLGSLQGALPQLSQAAQVTGTQGLDPGLVAALQGTGGSGGSSGGASGGNYGGIDLQALLKQLGYAA